jgi:alginate O-acetyltransferase complex protein AlgI
MVFASLTFLYIFLPLNLLLYYLWDNKTWRNSILTFLSLVFYAWGEPIWVSLLIFSAGIDYVNGLVVERYRNTKWAKAGVWSSVIINLALLVAFKYSGFIYENVNALFGTNFTVPRFALPIGISFYTFQTISYVIDVYRGEVPAQRNFLNFLLFVSLFHQLVAGPIVRYAHIANEIDQRKFTWDDMGSGIHRFCIGLFKKVCIANVAGEYAAKYLDADLQSLSVGGGWLGLIMFTFQIYFDFSAYSDMAIGLGKMFGFHYRENFNYPYVSRSSTEFWRRWHISLGSFFRDYVYIPLGGKIHRPFRNLFIVWFLTGFWHGAHWNFIMWGLYFGLLIALERLFLQRFLDAIPRFFSHIYLLFAVVIGWALFYFTDLPRLGEFFSVIFGTHGNAAWGLDVTLALRENAFWFALAILLSTPVYLYFHQKFNEGILVRRPVWGSLALVAMNAALLFMATAMLVGKSYNPFLYFRF